MKNLFVRGLVWATWAFAVFAVTVVLAGTSGDAAFEVPLWVPVAGLSLVFVGSSVLRRGLLDQDD